MTIFWATGMLSYGWFLWQNLIVRNARGEHEQKYMKMQANLFYYYTYILKNQCSPYTHDKLTRLWFHCHVKKKKNCVVQKKWTKESKENTTIQRKKCCVEDLCGRVPLRTLSQGSPEVIATATKVGSRTQCLPYHKLIPVVPPVFANFRTAGKAL